MRIRLSTLVSALVLCAAAAFAKPPVRYMSMYTLGVEYSAAFRGQFITEAEVHSLDRMHLLKISYSPIEYVQFYIGGGADRFEVEYGEKHFDGNHGFSPTAGLSANSPALVREILRVTANFDLSYINSEDDYKYKYSGPVFNPSLGIIAHAGAFVDVEAGAMGHIIYGKMKNLTTNVELDFSNTQLVRGYGKITLCSPSGAYAQVSLDVSPKAEPEVENGPIEASIGFSMGILITSDMTNKKLRERSRKYFPGFDEMKEREKKMKDDME